MSTNTKSPHISKPHTETAWLLYIAPKLKKYRKYQIIAARKAGEEKAKCSGCKKSFNLTLPVGISNDEILERACSVECSELWDDYFPPLSASDLTVHERRASENSVSYTLIDRNGKELIFNEKPANCPYCNGPSTPGRGWSHLLQDCPNIGSMKVKSQREKSGGKPSKCPVCGGASTRGRGFAHESNCSNTGSARAKAAYAERAKSKPLSNKFDKCPVCGGPSGRGRGFKHEPNCSNTAAARAKSAYAERAKLKPLSKSDSMKPATCSACGGPASKKGYRHVANCPESTQAKIMAKRALLPKCPKCGGTKKGRGFSHLPNCTG